MATIEVAGPAVERGEDILTAPALELLAGLRRSFGAAATSCSVLAAGG
jgi:hypothetical protein